MYKNGDKIVLKQNIVIGKPYLESGFGAREMSILEIITKGSVFNVFSQENEKYVLVNRRTGDFLPLSINDEYLIFNVEDVEILNDRKNV